MFGLVLCSTKFGEMPLISTEDRRQVQKFPSASAVEQEQERR